MSTYTSEPGTRLAGRYRLVDQVSAGAGWTYWKATDEALARPVTVLTFAADFPRVAETVTAARAASRLGDPRFSQVFDVEDAEESAYVVMEWVVGESLLDMVSEAPLDPPQAAALVSEAARAIARAHATGLAHLRLDPCCLHWTAGGGVKIAGLCVEAALAGPDGEGGEPPELTDTKDLARLLYAALTGYWPRRPGADETEPELLPAAPETDGTTCAPHQVSAGVPAGIDDVTCRALLQRSSRHGPALSTAAAFADALAIAAPPVTLALPPAPATAVTTPPRGYPAGRRDYQGENPPEFPRDGTGWGRPGGTGGGPGTRRSRPLRAVVGVVLVIILAAAAVAAWSLSRGSHTAALPNAGSHSASPAGDAVLLAPVSADSFDVYGNDGGNENAGDAKYAIDNNPGTDWHTDYYYNYPAFGNLKKGTGLIIDMGKQVRLSQVVVQFGTSGDTHVQIEIGNDDNPVPSALNSFTTVQSSDTARGSTTFNITSKATGRYLLIWITYLPPLAGTSNEYQAQIYNVTVHGYPAGQSG
jgi:hypothetical protein